MHILSYQSPKTNNYIQINETKAKGTTNIYLIETPYELTQPNHNPYELHSYQISIQRNHQMRLSSLL